MTPSIPLFLLTLFTAFPAQSQSSFGHISSGLSGQEAAVSETESFDEIMRRAAENGVSVIVVDTHGKELSNPVLEGADIGDDVCGMAGIMSVQKSALEFWKILVKRLRALPGSFQEVKFILQANSPTGEIWAYVEALLWAMLLFAIGYLFEREIYGKRFIPIIFTLDTVPYPVGYTGKLPFLVSRFFLRASGVLVSMIVAYILGVTILGPLENSAMQYTVALINIGYAGCRMVALLWRMILAPYACQYRISKFSNKDASRLYHWLWVTAAVDICTVVIGFWLFELGLTVDVSAVVTAILTAFVVSLNIALILVNCKAISRAIRNGVKLEQVGRLGRFVATAWAPLAILYFLFAWVDLSYRLVLEIPLSMPLVLGAYAILMSIIVVYGLINFLIERFFHRSAAMSELNSAVRDEGEISADGEMEAVEKIEPAQHPLNNFEDLARRVAGILAFVAGLWALTSIWHLESKMGASSGYIPQFLNVILILFIGYITYHLFRIWIDTKIKDEGGDEVEVEPGDEGGGSGASRLATLLPLFRNFILVVVVITIALIALLELGINVSPLFAGAGVAGLAIGFGA